MTSYFSAFPKINYNGVSATNITLRAKLVNSFSQQAINFYPYTIKDGETPDTLAYDYYGKPEYSWLIFMTNDIIDPYYDWPISTIDFDKYIEKKYGSVDAARDQIAYYKQDPNIYYINIDNNDFKTNAEYDAAVDGVNWKRVEVDADIIRVNDSSTVRAPWSYGSISYSNDDSAIPSGEWFKPTLTYISATGSLIYLDSEITLYENFDEDTWTSVSCYEEELELNENKRYIRLLDRSYVASADRVLKEILNG